MADEIHEISGYRVIPLKVSQDSLHHHYVYCKEHSVREKTPDKPPGRTLFVLNIPPYVEERGLKQAFSKAGPITSILLAEKPTLSQQEKPINDLYFRDIPKHTFKVAYVVFKTVSGLDDALTKPKLELIIPQLNVETGLDKWYKDYNVSVPDMKVMKEEIDTYMKDFDMKMQKKIENDKSLKNADDGGWVTVTKSGKRAGFARGEDMEKKINEKEALGKKRKELQHFYTFQIRQSKMQHIVSLRKKFDEDRKKISELRNTRKFKPF